MPHQLTSRVADSDRIKLRIAFVGLKQGGKTSILKRLVKGDFGPTKPTMGFNVDSFVYRGISVQATDLGGQQVFIDAFWKTFIPQSEAIVFVVDATNLVLLHQAQEALNMCVSWSRARPLLVILANKQDLPRAISKTEVIRRFKLEEITSDVISAVEVFATSAKSGLGIHTAFGWLISNLTGDIELPRVRLNSILVFRTSKKNDIGGIIRIQNDMREPEVAFGVRMYDDLKNLLYQTESTSDGICYIDDNDRMRYKIIRVLDPASRLGCFTIVHADDHPNSSENVTREALTIILETYPGIDSDRVLQQVRPFLTLPEHESPEERGSQTLPTVDTDLQAETPDFAPTVDDDRLVRPSERIARDRGVYVDPIEEKLIRPSERLAVDTTRTSTRGADVGFFTKLSVIDRIKTIEKKGLHGVRRPRE